MKAWSFFFLNLNHGNETVESVAHGEITCSSTVLQPGGLTCSVSSTEELLYLRLVSDPSAARRNRKRAREEPHTMNSQFVSDSGNVLWLCKSWDGAEEVLHVFFASNKPSKTCSIWGSPSDRQMIAGLHVLRLFKRSFSSMSDLYQLYTTIQLMFSKQNLYVPLWLTDLGTNDEGNGKCQQKDGGDDDVNRALRPSSLQWQAWQWHCVAKTGPLQLFSD